MFNGIKKLIKKNDNLYAMAMGIKNYPEFQRLVNCYFICTEESSQCAPLIIEHYGHKYPNKLIYWIDCYDESQSNQRSHSGMFANIRRVLEWLNFADILGMTPVVVSGKGDICYDKGMDQITTNVFEYYFTPVSEVSSDEVKDCYNVVRHRYGHSNFFMEHGCDRKSYKITEEEIERLGYLYKKYIHLNKKTEEYIESEITKLLGNKRTLGLHIRGTDFKLGLKNHPNIVSDEEFIDLVKEILDVNNYEQIFLATEDIEIIGRFQKEFGDKLVYYNDTFRTAGKVGPHNTYNDRPLHYYKLGLEVLRDVYTLAKCDSLICGLSQVAFAARYVKASMDQKYNVLQIVDHNVKQ